MRIASTKNLSQVAVALIVLTAASGAQAKPIFDTSIIADVAEKVTPAVVNITTVREGRIRQIPPVFRDFFGPDFQKKEPDAVGAGSGVIISANGQIVTNNHVIKDADEIRVTMANRREYKAKVIGKDEASDLAFLKIDASDLPYLSMGNSSKLRLGEIVLAIGNPFGVGQTVTMGIVSAKGRAQMRIVDYEDFIQTDASINPGNSGGALVNLQGELVGINTAILSRSGGAQGIGFAIPANMVRPIQQQISKYGKVRRGWLGVEIQDLTPALSQTLRLDEDVLGVVISHVMSGSPADKGGVEPGDVIIEVEDTPTPTTAKLRNKIALIFPGTTVKLKIIRDGRTKVMGVKLAEKGKKDEISSTTPSEDSSKLIAGLAVEALTRRMRARLGVPPFVEGVVITEVQPDSAAAEAGLAPGTVITSVNRKPVETPDDFDKAIPSKSKNILLRVFKNRGFSYVVLGGK